MAIAVAMASASASSLSLHARSSFSTHNLPRLFSSPSPSRLCFPSSNSSRIGFLSTITVALPRWNKQHRRAAQAEAKEVDEEQDADVSDSDYESPDEESDETTSEEVASPSIGALLKDYKEAVSNNDEAALADLEPIFLQLEKEKDTYAAKVTSLTEEVALVKERFLRLNADFDNFRKRSERERLAVGSNVKGDVVNSLLPMVDNFERAKTQIKIENEGEKRIDTSYQGIYKQFVEIMKGLGVSAVETVGKEFDPNIHEAIMREESAQYSEGVVIEEFRRGFLLGDKLLRPAMVKVSSGPPLEGDGEQVPETDEKVEE